ncbi:hypothetical protein [Cystobacter fuscus]|uniref:hypothetical protein n=1 Tax=Cystobacter fuscus TaxID=43 RepID=UPI0005B86970|nr:hypothetical protein [Cystobacter fuscus]
MLKKLVQANRDIYAHMAKDSTRGVVRPLAGTDHMGLATDKAQARLVVEAIREVLDATASAAMATGSSPPLPLTP